MFYHCIDLLFRVHGRACDRQLPALSPNNVNAKVFKMDTTLRYKRKNMANFGTVKKAQLV